MYPCYYGFESLTFYQADPDLLDTDPPENAIDFRIQSERNKLNTSDIRFPE